MSEVNAHDLRLIESWEDVWPLYQGVGSSMKTGVEIELSFFDPQSESLAPMNVSQNYALKGAVNEALGVDCVRNEPTADMLEIGTIAAPFEALAHILADAQDKILALTRTAQQQGLKRSYFQELPDKTAQELLDNLMDVPRYEAFFGPPREDMKEIAAYFSVCKSNQISVSYRDPDHMLANVRRLYILAPFLFMITDNSCGFDQGRPFSGHAGMMHRRSLGARGGVPSYVFRARDGEAYLKAHIDHVMHNPLFVYYDETGELVRLPSGMWTSFQELRAQGLNTASNYFFSESVLWPDVKIAALKDSQGQVSGYRYEARMFGVGAHQHQSALLIVAALAFHDECAAKVDKLLAKFGFAQDDLQTLSLRVAQAYEAAEHHNGAFLDISYGQGQLIDFAREFADILESSYLSEPFEEALAPILHICRTGLSDAKVNRQLFDTLDKVRRHQKNYDWRLMLNSNKCAAQIFERELLTQCA